MFYPLILMFLLVQRVFGSVADFQGYFETDHKSDETQPIRDLLVRAGYSNIASRFVDSRDSTVQFQVLNNEVILSLLLTPTIIRETELVLDGKPSKVRDLDLGEVGLVSEYVDGSIFVKYFLPKEKVFTHKYSLNDDKDSISYELTLENDGVITTAQRKLVRQSGPHFGGPIRNRINFSNPSNNNLRGLETTFPTNVSTTTIPTTIPTTPGPIPSDQLEPLSTDKIGRCIAKNGVFSSLTNRLPPCPPGYIVMGPITKITSSETPTANAEEYQSEHVEDNVLRTILLSLLG